MKRTALTFLLAALALTGTFSCNKDPQPDDKNYTDLSTNGTANCYIVSGAGDYSFPAVKGNSAQSVGVVASAELLWESFGTTAAPKVGDLITDVSFKDGAVRFKASGKKGNALIAAKDAGGTILWSWHIWMTETPKEQEYANNAGTMMDRNLGALSAAPGDWSACGLLYQWGRKDPFLGGCETIEYDSEERQTTAASSTRWPEPVVSDATNGTIEYAVAHPMTFILENEFNRDWFHTGDRTVDQTRWQAGKTIHDPCPAGWRIPQTGADGIWAKALGANDDWQLESDWDTDNHGVDFSRTSRTLGTNGPIWYPASGLIYGDQDRLGGVGDCGGFWSVSNDGIYGLVFAAMSGGYINPTLDALRSYGCSVRCQKVQE